MVCMSHKQPLSAWTSELATFQKLRSHIWLVASGSCIEQHRFPTKCLRNAALDDLQRSPSRWTAPWVCTSLHTRGSLPSRVLCSGPMEGVLGECRVLRADPRATPVTQSQWKVPGMERLGRQRPFCSGTWSDHRAVVFPESAVVHVLVTLLQLQH